MLGTVAVTDTEAGLYLFVLAPCLTICCLHCTFGDVLFFFDAGHQCRTPLLLPHSGEIRHCVHKYLRCVNPHAMLRYSGVSGLCSSTRVVIR